jgi:hypothetical protein
VLGQRPSLAGVALSIEHAMLPLKDFIQFLAMPARGNLIVNRTKTSKSPRMLSCPIRTTMLLPGRGRTKPDARVSISFWPDIQSGYWIRITNC